MDSLLISGEGFPGTNEYLDFAFNTSKKQIEGITNVIGNNVIFRGMNVVSVPGGQEISDGWLIRNGELLPFQGGVQQFNVAIIEEVTEAGYDNTGTGDFTDQQPVWKKRWCKFGDMSTPGAVASFSYSSLKGIPSIQNLDLTRTRFLKKGTAQLGLNDYNDVTSGANYVTGDFISVARQPNTFWTNEFLFKITFNSPINLDYFPLMRMQGGQFNIINSNEISIVEKTSSSLSFGLSPKPGLIGSLNGDINIFLIGV